MSGPLKVLVVEDSVDDSFFMVRELQRGGFPVAFERVETHGAMQAALEAQSWDLVICDDLMPQKARILLSLALTVTRERKAIQEMFYNY